MRIRDRFFLKGSTSAAIILIVVLTALVYASSLKNSFVWDDHPFIIENSFIKSWKNFPAVFSRDYFRGSKEPTYRPVVTISFFLDYSLWKLEPFGYHLTKLLLHISNVILLYFFIGLIAKDKRLALLSSLLFALHPVNSEAVNGIALRSDILAFLFYISSFMLFIKSDYYKGRKKSFAYLASVLLFLLALFSKEMAITLPILLMVYDYYFVFSKKTKAIFTHLKTRYIGYIMASLFYLGVWFFIRPVEAGGYILKIQPGSLYRYIYTMPKVLTAYIKWLSVPVNVHTTHLDSSFYSYSFFEPEVLSSVLLLMACLFFALTLSRISRLASFAILWFSISLLPVSNIAATPSIMACRYLYIPAVGFCLLLAMLLYKLPTLRIFSIPPNILRKLTRDAVVVLLIFYSVFTIIGNFAWRNSITFWLEAVEHYPGSARVHGELGGRFIKSGLLDKGIDECRKAIGIDPGFAKGHSNLGVGYAEKKQYQVTPVYLEGAKVLREDKL